MKAWIFPLFFALPSCQSEGSATAAGIIWHLREIDGSAFGASATLEFPEPGRIAGQAPCNRYSAALTASYPWFATGPVLSTKMACPELRAEMQFFAALGARTRADVTGSVLTLSDKDGREMRFTPATEDQ